VFKTPKRNESKGDLVAEIGTARGTIDRSDPSGEDLSKSIFVGFLTVFINLGIRLTGDKVYRLGKYYMFVVSGAYCTVLEKPMENHLLTHLVVLITASRLQGEQPLVN